MRRNRKETEILVFQAIKEGYKTSDEIAKHLSISKATTSKTCSSLLKDGRISFTRKANFVYYSVIEVLNAHDPFNLCRPCRTSSQDQTATSEVLESETRRGFGERIRHQLDPDGRSDVTQTGDGASHAYFYGKPKELRDIL